jgi:hypothetical protein
MPLIIIDDTIEYVEDEEKDEYTEDEDGERSMQRKFIPFRCNGSITL